MRFLVPGLLLLGAASRLFHIRQATILEGDFAVMGLMAKHVMELREFPIYVWLNHYGGTLSCVVVALFFKLFGISAVTYMITGFLSSVAACYLIYRLADTLIGRPGAYFALALAAFPPYNVFDITHWYQYGDTLTIGCFFFLMLQRYADRSRRDEPWLPAALGLISGLGLWTSPLFLPFLLTEIWVVIQNRDDRLRRDLLLWIPCFLAGYSPAIYYDLHFPGAQAHRFAGRVLTVTREEWESSHHHGLLLLKVAGLKLLRIPAVLAQVPAQFAEAAGWLDASALAAALAWTWRERSLMKVYLCFFFVVHALIVGDPGMRMMFLLFLPFTILVSRALADIWRKKRGAAISTFALLLAGQLYSLGDGLAHPPRMSAPELNAFLRSRGFSRAYSDYWTAYTSMFDSKEEILISPTLYHPTFSDRYPLYTEAVKAAPRAPFIVDRSRNSCALPELERGLERLGVKYRKDDVKEFRVYSEFSRKIFPEELKLTDFQKNCGD